MKEISSAPFETAGLCLICGRAGEIFLRRVRDRLYGYGGEFGIMRCGSCGLFWLSPRPAQADIGGFYGGYYTHQPPPPAGKAEPNPRRFGWLRDALREAVFCGYYGYKDGHRCTALCKFGAALGSIRPLRLRATAELKELLPKFRRGGVALDVGCGRGDFLAAMIERGWTALAVEPDAEAAKTAQSRGIKVIGRFITEADAAPASVDHITLNHSLEHSYNPVELLSACSGLLKPGGTLALYTPNGGSLGRRFFGGDWGPFDPPRHICVFTEKSLRLALEKAGFSGLRIYTFPRLAAQTCDTSLAIRRGLVMREKSPPPVRWSAAFAFAEKTLCASGLGFGEEIAALAEKR